MARRGADAGAGAGPATPPLSQFGVLVAQLESIAASAPYQPPDALLCFDLLSELVSAIEDEPKESIQMWQRKCEDALFALLTLGARRPVRRLASVAMGRVIEKGDHISIYSRASTLQGFLADGKKNEPLSCAGAAQCLGELYRLFGRKITAGLVETASIVSKLMKYSEDCVRQDALLLLENALEGSGGGGATSAYNEAFRMIMKLGVVDKSFIVRLAGARCLKTFGSIGWIDLGFSELENSMAFCIKGLEDQVSSVRDAFAEALGALLALAVNPEAQAKMKKGKNQPSSTKKPEDTLHKYLIAPFIKASGANAKKLRIGLVLSWVFFLQAINLKYHFQEGELQNFALKAIEMLYFTDPHALACVLYIVRVGVADQLTEPAQRDFLVLLGRKLESLDYSPSMRVATLRILSYLLKSLGEVPSEFKDILDNTVVASLSHSSIHVRVEAALTLCSFAEVDPTCVGGLISLGVTTLHALRETVSYDKGNNNLSGELESLHGQATVLAALVAISPKLILGYPARLPKSVFEVSKKMLSTNSRNPLASCAVKETGWLLLASLISSMPKEELEDQAFDILLLWADSFAGNPEFYMRTVQDWVSELRVLSVAIEALTAFIKSFISPKSSSDSGILLQPVLAYLTGALSLISLLCAKPPLNVKPALDLFTARVLIAYQSISDPLAYKTDHSQIMRICSSPFGDPYGWEDSSLLRVLLDKRDACLGPWIPGRDSFEDELRAFDGGVDGLLPCVYDDEIGNFPQPESISKMLVNQMLSCFGTIFACQDNHEKIVILNRIDQYLKNAKRQTWYTAFVTNTCVGLLSGLKSVLILRPQQLSAEILTVIHSIFQTILVESDNSAQRRAACEGLGLLARVANDVFTARMTRSLLGELAVVAIDPNNRNGSIALSLGCIHRSAGGMALSVLVPSTVSSISTLCKSSNSTLQLWSLHALLLTIEAAGLSYVPQVNATLSLMMEILLLDENGYVDLRQEIGEIINAIIAVIGPELSSGSHFFSRCQSVIAEISSCNETATHLESVRFTQQLVLFAPRAATVHSHVQNLIPTLFSRQPSLRHLAVSTLRHLIERDPDEMINENIEESLFSMLDEETDSEIANLVRSTINRLLSSSCPRCPSRWLTILRHMVLATSQGRVESNSGSGNDGLNGGGAESDSYSNDDDGMISSSNQESSSSSNFARRNNSKHLRYRTRVFAAECLSSVPSAVGTDPAHFDLTLARNKKTNDWLVLKLQELVSLSYQISTGQFEGMQPTGIRLLSVIMDKFGNTPDPEFPGHILLEQYQAQLVSAVRSTISTLSGPLLLDSGLELATKILTSSIVGGDRVALNRLYLLISRPLSEIQDLCYPSFADWVACKIKIRILTAHASVKCYAYQFFGKEKDVPDEYLQLMPLFSNNSAQLGKFWIGILKDYLYILFNSHSKDNYTPFLDGIDSPIVSSKVEQYLSDTWHLILQSTALDSMPVNSGTNTDTNETLFISGRSMVNLDKPEFQFIWGLCMLVLFQCQGQNSHSVIFKEIDEGKVCEVVLTVFDSLTKVVFFDQDFVSSEMCVELLQALLYVESNVLVVSLLSKIVQKCPDAFFEVESFFFSAMQLFSRCLLTTFQSYDASTQNHDTNYLLSELSTASDKMMRRLRHEHKWKFSTSLISLSYQSYVKAPTNLCLSKIISFLHNIIPFLKKNLKEDSEIHSNIETLKALLTTWAGSLKYFSNECIKGITNSENKTSESSKLFSKILVFSLQEIASLTQLAFETHSYLLEREINDFDEFVSSLFTLCSECFHDSLCDSNSRVKILGLHVLKTLAQRELANKATQSKNSSYFPLLLGELLKDIFDLLHNTLKRCEGREEIMIIEESLKLLFLFYTIVQSKEYQKDVTMILLEAFLLVFSISSNSDSQELDEANSITRRLVSHFVQIPLATTQIKDIMLSVPAEKRQLFQDMIRVSVGQGQITTAINSSPDLKPASNNNNNNNNNNDFEDDDWDAFQSLPATNNNAISSEENEELIEEKNQEITEETSQDFESTNLEDNDLNEENTQNEKEITESKNQEETEASSEEITDKEIVIDATNQESESNSTEKDEVIDDSSPVGLQQKDENVELTSEIDEKNEKGLSDKSEEFIEEAIANDVKEESSDEKMDKEDVKEDS